MGLDSSKLRPIAHATPEGRVAIYIGGAWQALPLGKALNLRDQIDRAIGELGGARGAGAHPTAFRARRADAILNNCLEAGGLSPELEWRIRQHLTGQSLPFPCPEGYAHA
jgi:hypothetical protein